MAAANGLAATGWLPAETLKGRVVLALGKDQGDEELLDELGHAGALVVFAVPEPLLHTACREAGSVFTLADAASPEELKALFEEVEARLGPVSVLIHRTGGRAPAPAHCWSSEAFRAGVADGLDSLFFAAAELARRCMARKAPGVILAILAAQGREEGQVAEAAVEGAVDNLIKTLAVEWARDGIRVNAILPAMADPTARQRRQLAWASAYLCSDYAAYITGHLLVLGIEHAAGH